MENNVIENVNIADKLVAMASMGSHLNKLEGNPEPTPQVVDTNNEPEPKTIDLPNNNTNVEPEPKPEPVKEVEVDIVSLLKEKHGIELDNLDDIKSWREKSSEVESLKKKIGDLPIDLTKEEARILALYRKGEKEMLSAFELKHKDFSKMTPKEILEYQYNKENADKPASVRKFEFNKYYNDTYEESEMDDEELAEYKKDKLTYEVELAKQKLENSKKTLFDDVATDFQTQSEIDKAEAIRAEKWLSDTEKSLSTYNGKIEIEIDGEVVNHIATDTKELKEYLYNPYGYLDKLVSNDKGEIDHDMVHAIGTILTDINAYNKTIYNKGKNDAKLELLDSKRNVEIPNSTQRNDNDGTSLADRIVRIGRG